MHETPFEDFKRQLALNLEPAYLVVSAAIPHLIARAAGRSSASPRAPALEPFSGAAGYITAKAGVLAFARAVGHRVQARRRALQRDPPERDRHARQPRVAAGRRLLASWVKPEEIAGVVRFLCSDESAPISGAAVPVYGRA